MVEFKESKFYKLLQDFFINNDKETFLQMLAEFYNRTEGIINKNETQDDLIKELRELYLEFNEKGIDENIVIEKVNHFVENNVKIKDILAKLVINTNKIEDNTNKIEDNTNKIEDNTEKLNINTNNIENINSQLDTIMKQSASINVNLLYPPLGLLPIKINDESLSTGVENTKRINDIITFYQNKNELVNLIFPKGTIAIVPTIRIRKNISLIGSGTRDRTILKDVSDVNEKNTLIIFSMSDENLNQHHVNRIWGGHIENIQINGNSQLHNCLDLVKTGWEGRVSNVSIKDFKGSAITFKDVFDSVWDSVTIYNCGGEIDGIIKYALDLDKISNITNAQHFNNLHIEDCRYMINLGGVRHTYFMNSKFEQNKANNDNINPVFNISANSREVDFIGCMFALNAVDEYSNGSPYAIKAFNNGLDTYTKFIGCDFATGNPRGMKLVDCNTSKILFDDCVMSHISGDDGSIILNGKSSIVNSKITCRVLDDGTCQPIKIGNATFLNNEVKVSGGSNNVDTPIITTTENNFMIKDNRFDDRISYKIDNTNKYFGDVTRFKHNIPIYRSIPGILDLGSWFYNVIKVNANEAIELTNIINYCNPGEEVIIYNTSGTNKITVKNVYGGFKNNTGQIRTKTQQDVVLGGDGYIILKWLGNLWYQIN